MDERIKKLSNLLVNYSTSIQPGETCLIDYEGECTVSLVRQLVKDIYRAGGLPFVRHRDSRISRELMLHCTKEQMETMCKIQMAEMQEMDAYIAIRGSENTAEYNDVPAANLNLYTRMLNPVLDYRVNQTKWVILRYPNASMAQLANSSQEAFEEFFFNVCTLDYAKMGRAMQALVDRMEQTDRVRLVGPGTDLTFSIKGIPAIPCDGRMNIPDGEVYTAPVRESVNGTISYNTKSQEDGFLYDQIRFEVKDGKIIKATANDTERINAFLDTDEGARYFGEFAIGVNPYVEHPMLDTLFDEKINGSFHLTPGMAYEDAFNGNKSANHWDLVMIQRPEYGGGEIWFDDVLIRKDGRFVIPELECLNPENLK